MAAVDAGQVAWWREPTKDQWYAWWAAWLGWTLDAFDFTVFLLIMKPIADEFGVPLTEVAFVLTVTLWMRLLGAVASGWLADRVGRKIPLMISILWYSVANFIAGFSPTFLFLAIFALCWASAWEPSGRPAPRSRWKLGRRDRAALWEASCRARGASAFCCRVRLTVCSIRASAGAAYCGWASCRPLSCCSCGVTSRSRLSGLKTAGSSPPKDAKCIPRYSPSSSRACSATP